MKIKVTFLATFRDVTGTTQATVDVEGGTSGDVIDALILEYGDRLKSELLESDGNLKKHVKVLLNGNFIDRNAPFNIPVQEGDTLALIPPIVAG